MDFDLATSAISETNSTNQVTENGEGGSNNNNGSRKGSPTPLQSRPPKSFHFTRRLSSNFPLVKSAESQLPFSDPTSITKFDELIDQFPKPPTNVEPVRTVPQKASNTSSSSNGSSWTSFKGLAERFNLFSKSV